MSILENMLLKRKQRAVVARAKSTAAPTGRDPNAPEGEEAYKPLEWPVVRKLLGWMMAYRWAYLLALVLNLIYTGLEMTGPMFLRHLIDHDIPGDVHPLTRWAGMAVGAWVTELSGPRRAFWNIGVTIGLWGCAVLAANLINRFNFHYNRKFGEKVILSIRMAVFEHLQRLSMSFYDKTKFGRILSRGTSDIDALSNPIINGINTVFINAMMMVVAATMLVISDWRIALAVLWIGPVLYFMNQYYRSRIGVKWRAAREAYTRVSTNLAENINGMRVVAAYNRQSENLLNFNELQDANTYNNVAAAIVNGMYQPLLGVVGYIGKVVIFIYGCYLVVEGGARGLTVGTLVALTMYWDWFMGPVLNFGNFHNEMMQSMASAERVFALLEQKPEVTDAADAYALPTVLGHVAFENVSFQYVKDKPVLKGVSFEALPGQTVALVGHTGCGKSTIMNLICRYYLPQTGRVLVDGHDLTGVTSESLHRQMGIVSQANYLFSGTVLENIRYAAPGVSEEEVVAAAKALGSHEILSAMKDGYHTQVGERGASMSLGQRQLICFTRAFVANPRILMLDEATSAVDTHTEMVIQEALEKLVQHRTTFIVAHRLSTVTRADQVIVMDHGEIIERGTHSSLLERGGRYAELYRQFTREVG
ncbi:MAG TPA: ABC transporter ATP-binding protein [Phycisphaerae bacterium]|nr:ABC transporter ATP-binding protein [Phycisphaerae bacterium]